MKTRNQALNVLKDEYGDLVDVLEESIYECSCPGVCMNDKCDYIAEYEHDQDGGWCEFCDTPTVKSLFLLHGLI